MPNATYIERSIEGAEKYRSLLSITFIYVCVYIGVEATSVSDRAVLLGEPIDMSLARIPELESAAISFRAFYVLSPLVIIGLHLHLLLQQHILAGFQGDQQGGDTNNQQYVLLPPPMFRYLIRKDEAWVGWIIQLAMFALYVLLPICVLCIVQFRFLPYHSALLTLYHQGSVAFDLGMLWFFLGPWRWPARVGRKVRVGGVLAKLACSLVLVFSLGIAVVPGTFAESLFGEIFKSVRGRYIDLSGELLVAGLANPSSVTALVSNGEGIKDSLERTALGAHLAGRDLRGADFDQAIMVNADLRGADLSGASLRQADLRGANLENATLVKADLRNADLAGLMLAGADLRGASLQRANLTGANLSHAKLAGANLSEANLRVAWFAQASLEGASLRRVTATGVSFEGANLLGIQLSEARLPIANFRNANLVGGDFRLANLQGAEGLRFELTDLRGAHLGCAFDVQFVELSDLRNVDLGKSLGEWRQLRSELEMELGNTRAATIDVALRRLRVAELQCSADERQEGPFADPLLISMLDTSGRRLLYADEQDEQRIGAPATWPPLAKQARGLWNEREYYRQLTSELLAHACSSPEFAARLAERAAGKYTPGDLTFDFELAEQLLSRVYDERRCAALRSIPQDLLREVQRRVKREKAREGIL